MLLNLYSALLYKRLRSLYLLAVLWLQALGHREVKFPEPRSITGRLLFWDRLRDQRLMCSALMRLLMMNLWSTGQVYQ